MALATALTLAAKFAPTLIGLFDKDKSEGGKVTQIANVVSDVAKSITGKDNLDDAEAVLSADPQLAYQFQVKLMEDKHVNARLDEQSRQRASEQFKINPEASTAVGEMIMKHNLILVALLVAALIAAIHFLSDEPELLTVVSSVIGGVINQLLNERAQVTSFHFGSSLGSKIKDFSKKITGDK